ncbi:MAG: NADH-quinone oxidoreductase subunit J [Chloroflexi bacterium]|nr:NADH-quinone oxidoreductase subunit J [Chloroflexota bacterium]
MGLAISFWLLAAAAVGSALAVVLLRNVFRAALLLISCFFAIAGLFVTLGADFLAMVQVLVYVGAIAVLLLLAIMLTREAATGSPFSRWRIGGAIASVALLAAMIAVFRATPWKVADQSVVLKPTTAELGARLLTPESGFVLPFEIASVLLLAAVLGAIVLVKEK